MALGASKAKVLRLFIGQELKLVLLGIAVGTVGAVILTELFQVSRNRSPADSRAGVRKLPRIAIWSGSGLCGNNRFRKAECDPPGARSRHRGDLPDARLWIVSVIDDPVAIDTPSHLRGAILLAGLPKARSVMPCVPECRLPRLKPQQPRGPQRGKRQGRSDEFRTPCWSSSARL
jgi:hypothetical protein